MVGGVLVLLGLFVTASISPHIKGGAPSRSSGNLGAARVIRRIRGDPGRMPDDDRMRGPADSAWPAGDEILAGPPGLGLSPDPNPRHAQGAAGRPRGFARPGATGEPPRAR